MQGLSLRAAQSVMRYDGVGTPMTALALTPEGCVLAGTSKGALIMCAPACCAPAGPFCLQSTSPPG